MWRTLFFRMPRLTAIAVLLAVAAGLGALATLGRQEDPTLVERYGDVITFLPGADAERIEALVTEPLERALQELREVDEIYSISRNNVSQINLNIHDSLSPDEVDEAWTLIREQIGLARSELPPQATEPDVTRRFVGAATAVVTLKWSEDSGQSMAVINRLSRDMRDMLQNLPGTEETRIHGAIEEEIHVIMDPEKLAAAGLNARQAGALIARADSKTPAGSLRSQDSYVGVEVDGEFDSISRIRAVPLVQSPDGSALRVSDVATVTKGERRPPDTIGFVNGERAIFVTAAIEPGIRVDNWADMTRERIDAFIANTPRGIDVELVFDQSQYTNERLAGLAQNLAMSAFIVFVVLFVLMGWRAALIVGSALPLVMLLVLVLLSLTGIPLHQMSVTGLVIALGLLIDNAIVVVDEIEIRRGKGMSRLEAIDKSLHHLFGPLFASTLTTALAFAPIALLPGGAGEFVGTIAISVIFSVSASFLVAMTVVAAFTGWFDRERGPDYKRRWWRDGIAFRSITDGYRWTIDMCLRFPPLGFVVGIVGPIAGFLFAFVINGGLPAQFFPQTERNQFQLDMRLPPEASIYEAADAADRAYEILSEYDEVKDVYMVVGEGAPTVYYNAFSNQNGVAGYGAGWVELDSNQSTRKIVTGIQKRFMREFPEAQFLTLPYEQGPPVDAPIVFFLTGPDLRVLNDLGNQTRKMLAETPGITYTQATLELGTPRIKLQADETAAELAGVRLTDIANDLSAELEGVIAGSVLEGVEEIPVRVLAPDSRRGDLSDLRDKRVGSNGGSFGTPLGALGDLTLSPEVAVITHYQGVRVNSIYGYLEPYAFPAPALEQFLDRVEAENFELPAGYRMSFGGEAAERGEAVTSLLATAVPLIILMSGCVALVFNSFRYAALVLLTGFLSTGLAFFGVWLFGLPLGFNAIIGAMGLLGIAINGTIVVLSALRANPAAVAGDRVEIRETTIEATRHIVATTLTTMGGFVPIILSGDLFWLPLATAIAGGVGGSAILALYFTPAMFAFGVWFKNTFSGKRAMRSQTAHSDLQPSAAE